VNRTKPNRTRIGRSRRKGKRATKAQLAALRAEREEYGITLQMVADEAAKTARFGTCGVPTVSDALRSGNSQNVLDALRRLIADRQADAEAKAS
jgi:hypothetical protein